MKIYKGYQIKPHHTIPTNYIVVTDGKGGKIPKVLDGMFTTPVIAMSHIDMYLAGKGESDGKTSSKS